MKGIWTRVGLSVTLAATALTVAAPAEAQRWRRNRGGDVATSALIGGVVGLGVGAAIASSNRDRWYRDRYYDRRGAWGPRRGWRGYDRGYYPPRGYYAPRGYYGPRGGWDRGWGGGGYYRGYDRGYYGGGYGW